MNSKLAVTKANSLLDARYRLNVQAQKLVLACLSKVDPRPDSTPLKEVRLSALDFGVTENLGTSPAMPAQGRAALNKYVLST